MESLTKVYGPDQNNLVEMCGVRDAPSLGIW